MKILRVIASVDPAGGGPIEGLRLTAALCKALGHSTEVVSLDDPQSPHVANFPFKVHGCGPGRGKYGYTSGISQWIAENGSRYDAAAIHGLWNHASVGGWIGLRKAGLPYVIYTHGMMDPWFRRAYPAKHFAKQIFWLLAQGKVLRDAHSVLFTCDEERKLARGVFKGYAYSERVVAYGTEEPPAPTPKQLRTLRDMIPATNSQRFVLFLSRVHEKKGCDLLVEAFSKIANHYADVDLVIAGPDQVGLQAKLRAQAAAAGVGHRIHWPGMLTGDAKWGAFHTAEAFILPSHQENFGIVVAEAMACGTPVLITDKVNIWREVKASGGGDVEPDTQDGISRLLSGWLSRSAEDKAMMGVAARAGFERHFHAQKASIDLISALEDACSVGR